MMLQKNRSQIFGLYIIGLLTFLILGFGNVKATLQVHACVIKPKPVKIVSQVMEQKTVHTDSLQRDELEEPIKEPAKNHLNKVIGIFEGPSGNETYYNLDMSYVVELMREKGYTEEDYPYWIREDGVKMFGKYVIVAANVEVYPKGTIIESSLGTAIVCDSCEAADADQTRLDIAVTW